MKQLLRIEQAKADKVKRSDEEAAERFGISEKMIKTEYCNSIQNAE